MLGLNLISMGIPCLYYGTEQAFDGAGDNDLYLRECMFGGVFSTLHAGSGALTCLYSTDPGQIGGTIVIEPRNGKVVMLDAPAGGLVIYG